MELTQEQVTAGAKRIIEDPVFQYTVLYIEKNLYEDWKHAPKDQWGNIHAETLGLKRLQTTLQNLAMADQIKKYNQRVLPNPTT